MAFNSLCFAVFFTAVFVVHWACAPFRRLRLLFLLAASYFFYMSWDWRSAGLLAGSTVLDFCVGLALSRVRREGYRRVLLAVSVCGNLGVLATFKYCNFFLDNLQSLLGALGIASAPIHLHLLLPVGISFYTFQTLTYTIDVYRRRLQPTRSLLEYAVFLSFFPRIVAGPITRASEFLPQLRRAASFDDDRTLWGLLLVFRGLFKKIAIADVVAGAFVNPVFDSPESFGTAANLLAVYAYALQIYCDFSAYSDIAIGCGKMLGLELPVNFNRPYLAISARDFWSRWHISLSTWLRDYLYIPLGGSRGGAWKTCRNLAITMLLAGLWHGAAWTFVLWGAFYGAWLMAEHALGTGRTGAGLSFRARLLRRVITFHLICFGWILFRADGLHTVWAMLRQIGTFSAGQVPAERVAWFALLLGFALHFLSPDRMRSALERFVRLPAVMQGATYTFLLVLFAAMRGAEVPFIYLQF
ncbi:MAG: MBOAT family O-acyltransferase [Phycisphaerae bacterium]